MGETEAEQVSVPLDASGEDILSEKTITSKQLCTNFFKIYWRTLVLIIWPLICAPILFGTYNNTNKPYKCLFVTCLMGGFWVTEALPVAITSMLPMVLFPILGVLGTEDTTMCYFKETNVMFISSIVIALAIEHCGLHNRIALGAMLLIGCSPRRLHFGLTMMTMFISFWIVNTAATAMMCPIIYAILNEFETQGLGEMFDKTQEGNREVKYPKDMALGFFLTAAYSSTIGGIATLVGTGTNLTFAGIYRSDADEEVSFTAWLLFGVPSCLIMTILTWLFLQVYYMGMFRPKSPVGQVIRKGNENENVIRNVIRIKLKDLGPLTFHETATGILFLLVVSLWFFRKPQFIKGWGDILESFYNDSENKKNDIKIRDATSGILTIILMFIVPKNCSFFEACSKDPSKRPEKSSEGLMTWSLIAQKTPWGLLFLLGGGFALAKGIKESGMSDMLGTFLDTLLGGMPAFLLLALVCLFMNIVTELTSNVAICNIFAQVCLKMASAIGRHPLYIGIPFAMSCSFSFMLPVGTPPNAVVSGAANIQTKDMIKAGFFVSLITWFVLIITWQLFGAILFNASGTLSTNSSLTNS